MKLHTYWGSSTAYRIRIALGLKQIDYQPIAVDLTKGAQHDAGYVRLNPGHGVPTLVLDDGTALPQSMAILDYLEEVYPAPALLPRDLVRRARVRAAALVIASEVHPVNNLRVRKRLAEMGHSPGDIAVWINDWMARGFDAFAAMIEPDGPFCFGDAPGLADICLVPQLYNARRWGFDLAPYPRLVVIEAACQALPAFATARPEAQPDAKATA
jgi:maleylacetoacetate isomerase